MTRPPLNPTRISYGYALTGAVAANLISGEAMERINKLCVIHDEPLIIRAPDRCAKCIALVLAEDEREAGR